MRLLYFAFIMVPAISHNSLGLPLKRKKELER